LCDCHGRQAKEYWHGMMKPVKAITWNGEEGICPHCHHYCVTVFYWNVNRNQQNWWKTGGYEVNGEKVYKKPNHYTHSEKFLKKQEKKRGQG